MLADDRHVCSVVVHQIVVDVDLAYSAPETENAISAMRWELRWIRSREFGGNALHVACVLDVGLGGGAVVTQLPCDVRPQPGARHGLLAAKGALVVVAGIAHSLQERLFWLISLYFEFKVSHLEFLVVFG